MSRSPSLRSRALPRHRGRPCSSRWSSRSSPAPCSRDARWRTDASRALERQVELIAAQQTRRSRPAAQDELGQFLATRRAAARDPDAGAGGAAAAGRGAERLARGRSRDGIVDVRGTRFLYAARRSGSEAIVLLRPAASQAADWRRSRSGSGSPASSARCSPRSSRCSCSPRRSRGRSPASPAASRALASGERPEPLPVDRAREVADARGVLQPPRGRARARAGGGAVVPALGQPRAEDAADGDPRPCRGASGRRCSSRRRSASVIEREARRLERLVGDLLDLARLRRRAFAVRAEPVDLDRGRRGGRRGTSAAARSVRRRAPGRWRSPAPSRSATQTGPAGALEPRRERAALDARAAAPFAIVARAGAARRRRRRARGSRRTTSPRAFERFYLYDRYGSERRVGTGLGLAIVQELATRWVALTSVQSEPGAARPSRSRFRSPGDTGVAREEETRPSTGDRGL